MRVLHKVKVGSNDQTYKKFSPYGGSSCMAKATPPIGFGTDPAQEDFNSPRYS
jgi:hypothetical protein